MPARVKLQVGLLLLAMSGLAVASTIGCARLLPILGLAVALAWLIGSLWAAFVYWPKFDLTGNTLWHGPRRQKRLALTFDDGPALSTAPILDILKARDIKATFFFLGERAGQHPELVARVRGEGHALGSHSNTHQKMHRMAAGQIESSLRAAEAALGEISCARGSKLLRVPHGFKSLAVVRTASRLGYVLCGWTLGVWDSDRPGAQVIARRAIAGIRPGCILLLHDGDGVNPQADRSQTVAALMPIIDYCLSAGYQFVTIPELFS